MTRTIDIFRPGRSFPSVSVTGRSCSGHCEHCSGAYLGGMADVSGDGALLEFGMDLWEKGGKGILVSGGCDDNGKVPLDECFLDQIWRLKRDTGLIINVHAGLVSSEEAKNIASAGVDVVSFDVIGSEDTIREVLHLERKVDDYISSMRYLTDTGLDVVPHVLAGLHFGEIRGEKKAVDIISSFRTRAAVLIILIPTRGTPMEDLSPTSGPDVLSAARYMRENLSSELYLGCMRPKGMSEMEKSILDLGFDGMVLPSKRTLAHIDSMGWKTRLIDACCAVPRTRYSTNSPFF